MEKESGFAPSGAAKEAEMSEMGAGKGRTSARVSCAICLIKSMIDQTNTKRAVLLTTFSCFICHIVP